MKKHLIVGVATAALAATSVAPVAFAEPPGHRGPRHGAYSPEDAAAFTDARIAALKAGLALTPAQEKNWPALETALREVAKARSARMAEFREKRKEEAGEQRDVLAGLRQMGKALTARGAELEKVADAAKPLYESLDEAQKRRFGMLLSMIGRIHGPHHWAMRSSGDDNDRDRDDD